MLKKILFIMSLSLITIQAYSSATKNSHVAYPNTHGLPTEYAYLLNSGEETDEQYLTRITVMPSTAPVAPNPFAQFAQQIELMLQAQSNLPLSPYSPMQETSPTPESAAQKALRRSTRAQQPSAKMIQHVAQK